MMTYEICTCERRKITKEAGIATGAASHGVRVTTWRQDWDDTYAMKK
jgi:hypothetical protein